MALSQSCWDSGLQNSHTLKWPWLRRLVVSGGEQEPAFPLSYVTSPSFVSTSWGILVSFTGNFTSSLAYAFLRKEFLFQLYDFFLSFQFDPNCAVFDKISEFVAHGFTTLLGPVKSSQVAKW